MFNKSLALDTILVGLKVKDNLEEIIKSVAALVLAVLTFLGYYGFLVGFIARIYVAYGGKWAIAMWITINLSTVAIIFYALRRLT